MYSFGGGMASPIRLRASLEVILPSIRACAAASESAGFSCLLPFPPSFSCQAFNASGSLISLSASAMSSVLSNFLLVEAFF